MTTTTKKTTRKTAPKAKSPTATKPTAKPKTAAAKTTRKTKPAAEPKAAGMPATITHEERWRMIAVAAYHKAERRGFAPGHEVEDWLKAEQEISAVLAGK